MFFRLHLFKKIQYANILHLLHFLFSVTHFVIYSCFLSYLQYWQLSGLLPFILYFTFAYHLKIEMWLKRLSYVIQKMKWQFLIIVCVHTHVAHCLTIRESFLTQWVYVNKCGYEKHSCMLERETVNFRVALEKNISWICLRKNKQQLKRKQIDKYN